MLKIGMVGSGFMGMVHAAAWAQTPARVTAVYSESSTREMEDTYGVEVCNNLDALLDRVDVVDICTPTHLHYAMVLQAAEAGKDIVCEKPLARTYAHAKEMVEVCEAAGVRLLVGHVVRFFPEYALAKQTVDRNAIGRVAVVRLTRASFKPNGGRSWFHDPSKSGGMMMDLMIHDFDYARWVAGEVESVFAKNAAGRFRNVDGDYALAILRHRNGALSHVEGGWAYPKPMFRTSLEIAGDKGLIEHPAGSSTPLSIHLKTAGQGDLPDIAVPTSPLAEDPYVTEIKHFYDVLAGMYHNSSPRVTAHDGLAAVQIALAAIESARTGRRVYLEEVAQ